MPQLWIQQNDQEPPWAVVPLDEEEDVHYLTGDSQRPVVSGVREEPECPAYVIRHPDPGGQESWLLFAASGQTHVSVNGVSVELGVRSLTDKDEIQAGECVMFFSMERLARMSTFPGIGKPCKCPRCQSEIHPGSPAVQCPGCSVWHHQSEESPCWTYAEKCAAFCDQPTSLEGSFQWAPEAL